MTLKSRAIALLVLLIFCLLSVLSLVSSTVLIKGFEEVEEKWDYENLDRVKEGFEATVDNLAVKSADWAIWSDTYNYIVDPKSHQDYVTSNLNDVTFGNLQIDHFFLINNQGDFVYEHSFDGDTNSPLETPPGLVNNFKGKSDLLLHPDLDEVKKGVLAVDQVPVFFVSRAILTSEKKGPSHGSLVFARDIDQVYLDKLSKTIKFNLKLILPNDVRFQDLFKSLSSRHQSLLRIIDENLMDGYVLIDDAFGKPAFIFQVPMSRDVAKEAQHIRWMILMSFSIITIIFGVLLILALNRLLLNRIFNMTDEIRKLSKMPGMRLKSVDMDELSEVGSTINSMLDVLENNAQQSSKQQEHIRQMEKIYMIEQAKRLEELQLAHQAAQNASQAKSQFLANMSHEIRTPLNAILGFSDLLRNTSINEDQKKYLETITASGQLLASVINDILDISKIEAGKIQFEIIDFDLYQLLEQAITISKDKVHGKDVKLVFDFDANLPRYFKGDSTRIQQIVVNFLSNAAKFTEKGKIVLSAQRRVALDKPGDNKIGFWIGVQDTGIGIPQDKIGSLFKPFTQADTSTTRKFGGTGLGLAICKSLVEMMEGRIWVESKEGQGSCFQFEMCLTAGHSPKEAVAESKSVDFKGAKILVVEDSKPNQELMKAYFKVMGITAEFANNGKEAVEHLRLKNDYLLILMDMQMPVMGGIEATQVIRAQIDKDIPIIALTAAVLKEDQDNCMAAGMNGFLTKPLDIKKLKSTILDYISRKG